MGVRLADGARAAVGASGAGEPTVGDIPWTHDEDDLPDAVAAQATKREKMGAVPGDTVHFDIVDRDGNMVSSTPSGGWLHSSPVIPELGFCLGTRAQMFWLEEGHPASLAPGKRPRSTLTPTMALRDGEPYLAWGSPGGDQQDQWITQFFLRHVHAGMNLQEAIDAPAWHTEHFLSSFWPRTARPGVVVVEGRVPKATQDELKKRGHKRRGRARLVRRAPDGRLARRQAPQGRRQSARHAGLRGGDGEADDLVAHRARSATGRSASRSRPRTSRSAAACRTSQSGIGAVATQALSNPFYGVERHQAPARRACRPRRWCRC